MFQRVLRTFANYIVEHQRAAYQSCSDISMIPVKINHLANVCSSSFPSLPLIFLSQTITMVCFDKRLTIDSKRLLIPVPTEVIYHGSFHTN